MLGRFTEEIIVEHRRSSNPNKNKVFASIAPNYIQPFKKLFHFTFKFHRLIMVKTHFILPFCRYIRW